MEKNDFIKKLSADFTEYCESSGLSTQKSRSKLMRALFDAIAESGCLDEVEDLSFVQAPNTVVEAVDGKTGLLLRRYLELEYTENDNGIRLSGEDMAGRESHIVFLSGTAIEKINDLQGRGRDHPGH